MNSADLVARLRQQSKLGPINVPRAAMRDAADRIEALEAERDRLREAIYRVLSPAPGVRKPEPWVYGILRAALQKEPQP